MIRKYKQVSVSPELLFEMFKKGNKIRSDVIEGIPETAKFIKAGFYFNEFFLLIEDESFEDLGDGEVPFQMDVVIKRCEE